jgi:tetratricopeptide (TPR) repeat protein
MRIFVVTALVLSACVAYAANVDDFISRGDLTGAQNYLSKTYGRDTESAEYLFLQGLTTFSGESSASHLKDFINRTADDTYVPDWARLILGKYYLAQGLYLTARKQLQSIPEGSPFWPEANYLAARCYLQAGEYEDAILEFNKIVDNPNRSAYANWAVLNTADAYYEIREYQEAERYYYSLLKPELEDDIYPLALLGMVETEKALNKSGDAERYYRTYEDRYKTGITLADYQTNPNPDRQSSPPASTNRAPDKPERSGGRYYIQIGAFSVKENALKLAGLYRESGYDVYMETYIENGKEFYRILIGGYNSKQQAEFIQRRLEKAMGEKYILLQR